MKPAVKIAKMDGRLEQLRLGNLEEEAFICTTSWTGLRYGKFVAQMDQ